MDDNPVKCSRDVVILPDKSLSDVSKVNNRFVSEIVIELRIRYYKFLFNSGYF